MESYTENGYPTLQHGHGYSKFKCLGINYIPFNTETPVQSFQNFEPIAMPTSRIYDLCSNDREF